MRKNIKREWDVNVVMMKLQHLVKKSNIGTYLNKKKSYREKQNEHL